MNYFLLELFLGIGVMLLPFLGVVIWRKMPVFHGIGVILLGIYLGCDYGNAAGISSSSAVGKLSKTLEDRFSGIFPFSVY